MNAYSVFVLHIVFLCNVTPTGLACVIQCFQLLSWIRMKGDCFDS